MQQKIFAFIQQLWQNITVECYEYVNAMITQEDLARKLGISQVSVSRALRNKKGISEKLRQSVLEEARKSGYSIEASNFEARLMRNRGCGCVQRTNIFCAIVTDENDPFGFGGRLLRGINQAAENDNYDVVIVTRVNGSLPRVVLRRQVDGVIRMLGDLEIARGILPCPLPWVSVLYDVDKVDLVSVDNLASCREIGRRLGSLGHRHAAFIGPDTQLARERVAGLRMGLAEFGGAIPDDICLLRRFACNYEPTRELLTELFQWYRTRDPAQRFTAIAAYNDFMGELAVRFVMEKGLRVPDDISVTGFDGVLPSKLSATLPMTTAVIPLEEMGASAFSLLRWRLDNADAPRRKIILDAPVRDGKTLGLLPR